MRVRLLLPTLAAVAMISPLAHATGPDVTYDGDSNQLCASYNDGSTGFVGCYAVPAAPRAAADTSGDRGATSSCIYTTEPRNTNTALSVRGVGEATGRPRAVSTQVQCIVVTSSNQTVFNLTRAEAGAVAVLSGAVTLATRSLYTVCTRATATFDDGEVVTTPLTCVTP